MHLNPLLLSLLVCSILLLQACATYQNYIKERNALIRSNQIAQIQRLCHSELSQTASNAALNGQNSSTALQYYEQYCSKHSLKPDPEIWQQGYTHGNQQYCQLTQAYESGKNQLTFNSQLCSQLNASKRNTRVDANRYGLEIARQYAIIQQRQRDIEQIKSNLNSSQKRLEQAEKDQNLAQIKQQQSFIRQQQRDLTNMQYQLDQQKIDVRQTDLNYRNLLILKERDKF